MPLYYVKQENSSQGFQPLGCQAENLVIGELVNYIISKNGKGVVLIHGFTDLLIN